jgi:LysM repeat protein
MGKKWIVMLCVALAVLAFGGAGAQQNLLTNGPFDPPFATTPGLKLANGWSAWGSADFYDEVFGSKRSGQAAQAVGREGDKFTAGVFQIVNGLPSGIRVRFGAWSKIIIIDDDVGTSRQTTSTTRVGIDPTGGTNPSGPNVVWSGVLSTASFPGAIDGSKFETTYVELTVEATTNGGPVTVFTWGSQVDPAERNLNFWDDAYLINTVGGPVSTTVGGTPGAPTGTPVPPTSAFVAVAVTPQAPQADGSLVHVVQEGHTLSAIASAYGTTVAEIQRLNNLSSARFIRVGQPLLIREAGTSSGSTAVSSGTPRVTTTAAVGVVGTANSGGANATPTRRASTLITSTPRPNNTTPIATAEVIESTLAPTRTPNETAVRAEATAVATTDVEPTATDGGPTLGVLCAAIFDDANQNGQTDAGESNLSGGTLRVSQAGALVSDAPSADALVCFEGLGAGEYQLEVSAPDGYQLTTGGSLLIQMSAGQRQIANFGATNQSVALAPTQPAPQASPTAALETVALRPGGLLSRLYEFSGLIVLGIVGVIIVGSIGLTLFLRRGK